MLALGLREPARNGDDVDADAERAKSIRECAVFKYDGCRIDPAAVREKSRKRLFGAAGRCCCWAEAVAG